MFDESVAAVVAAATGVEARTGAVVVVVFFVEGFEVAAAGADMLVACSYSASVLILESITISLLVV